MSPSHSTTDHGLVSGEFGVLVADRPPLDHLFSVTYEKLRRLAASVGRDDPAASLSATA